MHPKPNARSRPKAETYFIESLRLLAERIQERADLINRLAKSMEEKHTGCFLKLNHTVSVKEGLAAIEKLANEGFDKLSKGQWGKFTIEFVGPLNTHPTPASKSAESGKPEKNKSKVGQSRSKRKGLR